MKNIYSNLFKILLLAVTAAALFQEMVSGGQIVWRALYYFTIQSNFLVLFYLLAAFFVPSGNHYFRLFRGIALVNIVVTGLVYNFVLYNIFVDWGTAGYTFSRTVTHLVTPLGFVADWLIFERHEGMKWSSVSLYMAYPVVYGLLSLYASHKTGFVLYFFLNASGGFSEIRLWLAVVFAVFLFVSAGVVYVDNVLKPRPPKTRE